MIARLRVCNFKRLGAADIELGGNVVFIGPNNSGQSTALQALTLRDAGWRRWSEKREKKDGEGHLLSSAKVRQGVTLNRRELHAIPVKEIPPEVSAAPILSEGSRNPGKQHRELKATSPRPSPPFGMAEREKTRPSFGFGGRAGFSPSVVPDGLSFTFEVRLGRA
jgi:hypothetical protein